ncbi:hypothetical protein HALLA_05905 [Halostagnicola larsenii XH-48]|uniref:Uncharacterized protein n=1 Tax=Halostagnicola larsenii XH-48 TaxID=797299 RepID=W0JQ59_9EURY|nr:hypothetical protein [Halostagnicola larsenii]AHG00744.1 hypothetical protein HALLA_05905 [Halostagnicola larsenii XH-48]
MKNHDLTTESTDSIEEQLSLLEADLKLMQKENEELKVFIRAFDKYLLEEIQIDVFDYMDGFNRDNLSLHDEDEFDFSN